MLPLLCNVDETDQDLKVQENAFLPHTLLIEVRVLRHRRVSRLTRKDHRAARVGDMGCKHPLNPTLKGKKVAIQHHTRHHHRVTPMNPRLAITTMILLATFRTIKSRTAHGIANSAVTFIQTIVILRLFGQHRAVDRLQETLLILI